MPDIKLKKQRATITKQDFQTSPTNQSVDSGAIAPGHDFRIREIAGSMLWERQGLYILNLMGQDN